MRFLALFLSLICCGSASAEVLLWRNHPTIQLMAHCNASIRGSHVVIDERLCAAAQMNANYMASTGQFSHYCNGSPQGRAQACGFHGLVRENIAMNQGSCQGAFHTWRYSPGHLSNILSGCNRCGFGLAYGRNGVPYYVSIYGNE